MVQIGNFHIGQAQSAQEPVLHSGESFLMWDHLVSRYDIIEQTQIFQNFAHDIDFKVILSNGLEKVLEKQVDDLEKQMNKFEIPLPKRPPKSIRVKADSGILEDAFMFRTVYTGIQSFLEYHVKTISSITTNDALRDMFIGFLKEELDTFGNMSKYGKLKGWLQNPPVFKH